MLYRPSNRKVCSSFW
uniref:Uncharacterized protein n=1 Tax=Rhizophora mucronata TaxID=61149 RepID=A0A2P2N0J6_RHIMU